MSGIWFVAVVVVSIVVWFLPRHGAAARLAR